MSTIQSVKNQIQTLIDNANATTGKGDTNLTTAQNSLIEGYGQGGSGGSGSSGISRLGETIVNIGGYTTVTEGTSTVVLAGS